MVATVYHAVVAQQILSANAVEQGYTVIVTKRGSPVAKLVGLADAEVVDLGMKRCRLDDIAEPMEMGDGE